MASEWSVPQRLGRAGCWATPVPWEQAAFPARSQKKTHRRLPRPGKAPAAIPTTQGWHESSPNWMRPRQSSRLASGRLLPTQPCWADLEELLGVLPGHGAGCPGKRSSLTGTCLFPPRPPFGGALHALLMFVLWQRTRVWHCLWWISHQERVDKQARLGMLPVST